MSEKRFDEKLTELLKTNSDFVDDTGELRRENIKNRAWDFDRELVNLLLSDETIASHFFHEVSDGRFIFNNKKFVEYFNSMNLLAKSHTRFKNKIGLTIDDKYLRERGEVSLAFPYKDCVLEGGQTKEDDKRNEVFFNELIAKDEITRMLDPKVLTNWKRYTTIGEEDVTEIKRDDKDIIRENLIIKGNNLVALSCLEQQFRKQVKLIYIDPPYNTKGDANIFGYNNNFNHSTWLTFMKNRIDAAKNLLAEDGVMVIAIDDHEYAHLKLLCDEAFGRDNYIGTIVVQSKPSGQTTNTHFATCHEYALFYAKSIEKIAINKFKLTPEQARFFNHEDNKGKYHLSPFRRSGGYSTPQERPNSFYPIYYDESNNEFSLEEKAGFIKIIPIDSSGKKRVWRQTPQSFLQLVQNGEIVCKRTKGKYTLYIKDRIPDGRKSKTIWSDAKYDASAHGTMLLKNMFDEEKVFSYPKSIHTVKDTIYLLTQSNTNDIILDFFAGSGTTGHAIYELNAQDGGNRQFILVEQLEKHIAVCKERLEKVMTKGNFISCELMRYNQNILDRIQSATESETLLDIWREMCTGVSVLKWYLDTDNIEESEKAFIAIDDVEQQQIALIELLNKTHLYVHFSEMDDENAKVNDTDKRLTRLFYEGDADAKS